MAIIGSSTPDSENVKVAGTSFNYSTVRLEDLEASEYTLVGIVNDVSGSVGPYKDEMENVVSEVVESCLKSPRADNLLIRHTTFGDYVRTNHDWKMLKYINPGDYKGSLQISGMTALCDGAIEAISVTGAEGERLSKAKFTCNGIIFFITDGAENASHSTPLMVKKAIEDIQQKEKMESLITILIGVNAGSCSPLLRHFQQDAGITHFIEVKDASKKSLAKLAAFVSKSISSQSQALSSGGPSKQLTSGNLTI